MATELQEDSVPKLLLDVPHRDACGGSFYGVLRTGLDGDLAATGHIRHLGGLVRSTLRISRRSFW